MSNPRKITPAEQKLTALLQHAINDELDQVDTLLTEFPQLAFMSGRVTAHAGFTAEGTVLNIAAGTQNIGLQPDEVGMLDVVCTHLRRQPGGEDEIKKRLSEQFPANWRELEKQKIANDLAALNKVFRAIKDSTSADDCKQALLEFVAYLNASAVYKTGRYFIPAMLNQATKLYDEHYTAFGAGKGHKNGLMCCEVIGGIQRTATNRYAGALVQGLTKIIASKQPLKHGDLIFKDSEDKERFFPLDENPDNKLGKHFALAADGDRASIIWNNEACRIALNFSLLFRSAPFLSQTHVYFKEFSKKQDAAFDAFLESVFSKKLVLE